MAANNKYRTEYSGKDGWMWRVTFMPSGNYEEAFITLDIGSLVVVSIPTFEGGYDKLRIGCPTKVHNAKINILLDNIPDYMRERIINPTALIFGIETQNVWIFETDRGSGGAYEIVFQGMQSTTPEDVYKKDSTGRRIAEISMTAAEIMAHRLITNELLRQQCHSIAAQSSTTVVASHLCNAAWRHSSNNSRNMHLTFTEGLEYVMMPFQLLFQAMKKLWTDIMQVIMRSTNYFSYYVGDDNLPATFYKPNFTEQDEPNFIPPLTTADLYLIVGIQQNNPIPGTLLTSDKWVAGLLSSDSDSFEGAGYKNGWDLLHWIAVGFFSCVKVTPGRIHFTAILTDGDSVAVTPEFEKNSKEFKRGAAVIAGVEATIQGSSSDDISPISVKKINVTKDQEVTPIQILFTNAPGIPPNEDHRYGYYDGYGEAIFSNDIHTHGMYFRMNSDFTNNKDLMVRAHCTVVLNTGVEGIGVPVIGSGGVPVDDYTYPMIQSSNIGNNWKDLRAAYLVQQRSAGLGFAIANAMLKTYGNYYQGITSVTVLKKYAMPCDAGSLATIDNTDIASELSVINQNTVLLNVSTDDQGRTSKVEYLHRGAV